MSFKEIYEYQAWYVRRIVLVWIVSIIVQIESEQCHHCISLFTRWEVYKSNDLYTGWDR